MSTFWDSTTGHYFEQVFSGGENVDRENESIMMMPRNGKVELTDWNFSFSPLKSCIVVFLRC